MGRHACAPGSPPGSSCYTVCEPPASPPAAHVEGVVGTPGVEAWPACRGSVAIGERYIALPPYRAGGCERLCQQRQASCKRCARGRHGTPCPPESRDMFSKASPVPGQSASWLPGNGGGALMVEGCVPHRTPPRTRSVPPPIRPPPHPPAAYSPLTWCHHNGIACECWLKHHAKSVPVSGKPLGIRQIT